MKFVNEHDFKYRNGNSGVKYLMRGPSIDWGVILLKPGEFMAEKAHGHDAPEGTVFLVEPKEMHNIKNNSKDDIKIIFIKGEYKPDDKIE
jgi:hypothetical protein